MIKGKRKINIYFLPLVSILLVIALLFEPNESIIAAKGGLSLWFNTVLPSLLPFIIGANLLFASGSTYFFEKIFSPIMKPLFNVPGCSSFPWIMGLISGYPMGAKIIAQLRSNNQINDVEVQRLLGFCNNSGPFFILGAVGIGMLGDERIGYFLLLIHFISSFIVGILFRFYGKNSDSSINIKPTKSFIPAVSIGEALGTSVASAMEVIVQIGGYIIIFSVIGSLLKETSLIETLSLLLYKSFKVLGLSQEASMAWILGIIEMSTGIHMVSNIDSSTSLKLAIISFLLGWGGFSIHAQSIHLLRNTNFKINIYLLAKLIQGIFSFVFTILLFPSFHKSTYALTPTFSGHYYKYSSYISIIIVCLSLFIYTAITFYSQRKNHKAN